MTATHSWASEVLCDLVQMHVAVIDLDEKLHRALQPDVQAPDARRFDDDTIVQIAQRHIFEPRHQKSSAEGMRL